MIVTYMRSTSEITGFGAPENEALTEPSRIELCVFSWNADSGARCLSSWKFHRPLQSLCTGCNSAAAQHQGSVLTRE